MGRSQSLFGRCRKQTSLWAKPGTKPLLLRCIVCSLVTKPTELFRLPYRWKCASQFKKRISSSLKQTVFLKNYIHKLWRCDSWFTDRKDLEITGRVILKWIVEKMDGRVWTEFTWLRRGNNEHGYKTWGSIAQEFLPELSKYWPLQKDFAPKI